MIVYLDLKIIYKEKAIRMRIKERLLQYKQELQKQTMYKEGAGEFAGYCEYSSE